jgi:hypothetical protein
MCMRARGAMTLLFSMCVHCLRSRHMGTRHHSRHALGAGRCCVAPGACGVAPPVACQWTLESRHSTRTGHFFSFLCLVCVCACGKYTQNSFYLMTDLSSHFSADCGARARVMVLVY